MSNLMQRLGEIAKVIAYMLYAIGILSLVSPLFNGKWTGWDTPLGMGAVASFWWLLGWWFEKQGQK